MTKLVLDSDPEVEEVIGGYPKVVGTKLKALRKLIIQAAEESDQVDHLEETLKWGEPSYLAPHGSTVRIDWKSKSPEQYCIYFKCTSKLVETFKELYPTTFRYETTRAIAFDFDDDVPVQELKHCITMALTYHKIKDQPLLGQ